MGVRPVGMGPKAPKNRNFPPLPPTPEKEFGYGPDSGIIFI